MFGLFLALMILAFIAFIAATFNAAVRINLVAAGLALWLAGYMIQVLV